MIKETPTSPFVTAEHIATVDYLIKLKRECPAKMTYTDHLWENIIPSVVKLWKHSKPAEYKSYIVEMDDIRETRKNEYASSLDKETGIEQRYIVDIPQFIISVLRLLYTVEEMPMNKEFFRDFARKFPEFKVAQKI